MKVLVAGAGGYIGIPTCETLLNCRHEVIALDRYFFGVMPDDRCQIVKHDIRWFDPAILTGVDAVIDLAGLSNDATGDIDPELTRDINVNGGIRLATLAKEAGVKRYVYSSSASVYGYNKDICTEETSVRPLTVYAESKVRVEDALQKLASKEFSVTVLRNGTVYALADRMRYDLAVNAMAARAKVDGVILVNGSGQQRRPFVSVGFVARKLIEETTLFIGSMNVWKEAPEFEILNHAHANYTIEEIAKRISSVVGAKIIRVPVQDDRRDYAMKLAFDYRNTEHEFFEFDYQVGRIASKVQDDPSSFYDPRTITLKWYKHLMDVEKLMIGGRMF
jgi:nucleoside-diphosphate-sugar epimerase